MDTIRTGNIVALTTSILAAPGRDISTTEWDQEHTFPPDTLGLVVYKHGNSCVITTNLQANPEEDRTRYLITQAEQLRLVRGNGWSDENGIFRKLKEERQKALGRSW